LTGDESTLRIPTPEVFVPLFRPACYKGAYGGRGSGKSFYFAERSKNPWVEKRIAAPSKSLVAAAPHPR
jgi:hypothetical protein